MLSAFLHHDTLFAEMVEPLLSHVWSQAEVDANVVFQFHISCCLMVRCFLYSLQIISLKQIYLMLIDNESVGLRN